MNEQEFDKPLDTPIIEHKKMVVSSPIVNPDNLSVDGFKKKEIEIQEYVTYTALKNGSKFCKNHYFNKIEETKAGYTAICKYCEYGKFVNPVIQTIKNGKIIERSLCKK